MRRGVRVTVALAGVLAILVVTIAILVAHWYPVDRYRRGTEERLTVWLGAPVKLGTFSVSLLGGIGVAVDGVEVGPLQEPRPAAGAILTAELAQVRLALWSLLRGEVRVRGLELWNAELDRSGRRLWRDGHLRIDLERLATGALRGTGSLAGHLPPFSSTPFAEALFRASLVQDRLEVEEAVVRLGGGRFTASGSVDGLRSPLVRLALAGDATIGETRGSGTIAASWGDPSEARLDARFAVLRGADLAMLVGLLAAGDRGDFAAPARTGIRRRVPFRVSGAMRADQAELGRIRLEGLRTNLVYENERVALPDLRFELYGGEHSGSIAADLSSRDLPFRWTSRLEGVDVGRLADALAGEGRGVLKGTGRLELDVTGNAPGGRTDRNSIRGTAALEVLEGSVLNVGVLAQVAALAERADRAEMAHDDTPFHSLSALFSLDDGLARTTDLTLRSADVDLEGTGSVALDGALDLDLVALLAPAITTSLEERVPSLRHWNRADGRLACPIRVAGSMQSPRVKVDLDRAASQGLAKFLEEKGKKGVIRRLLGGR